MKLLGVCAVCFGEQILRRDRPIRHGFHAINVQHGTSGGWHTGPCPGGNFPHFGLSSEGSIWALGAVRQAIDAVTARIAELHTRPVLTWTYRPKARDKWIEPIKRELQPGTPRADIEYRDPRGWTKRVSVPSYDQEHASLLAECKMRLHGLESDRETYEKAIATWQPRTTKPAPQKREIVHLARTRKWRESLEFNAPACRGFVTPAKAQQIPMTADPAAVTCRRCGGHVQSA